MKGHKHRTTEAGNPVARRLGNVQGELGGPSRQTEGVYDSFAEAGMPGLGDMLSLAGNIHTRRLPGIFPSNVNRLSGTSASNARNRSASGDIVDLTKGTEVIDLDKISSRISHRYHSRLVPSCRTTGQARLDRSSHPSP